MPVISFLKCFSQVVIDGLTMLKYALMTLRNMTLTSRLQKHDFNGSQIPPNWHSWITHIRKDPPTEDAVMQNVTPPWQSVCSLSGASIAFNMFAFTAICGEHDGYKRCLPIVQHCCT